MISYRNLSHWIEIGQRLPFVRFQDYHNRYKVYLKLDLLKELTDLILHCSIDKLQQFYQLIYHLSFIFHFQLQIKKIGKYRV